MPQKLMPFITASFVGTLCFILPSGAHGQERVPVSKGAIRILKEVPLSSEIPGHLIYVNPTEEGQLVRKGEVVIRLNDDLITAQHLLAKRKAASEVEIKFAEVALDKATVDLEVQMEANSLSPGTYTESEIRQSRLEVKKAEAQLEKSKEDKIILELEAQAKGVELKQYEVESPIDGVVTEVHRWPGEAVRQGDAVLTITDLTVVRAVLDVDYGYRDLVSVGDSVEVIATGRSVAASAEDNTEQSTRPAGTSILSDFGGSPALPGQTNGNQRPAPPGRTAGERFTGTVTYISTKLTAGASRQLEVYVNVPNRQDGQGRFLLLEGVEVQAWILHQ